MLRMLNDLSVLSNTDALRMWCAVVCGVGSTEEAEMLGIDGHICEVRLVHRDFAVMLQVPCSTCLRCLCHLFGVRGPVCRGTVCMCVSRDGSVCGVSGCGARE